MSQASSNDDSQSIQPEVVPLDPFWLTRWISLRTSIKGVSKVCSRDKTLKQFIPLLEALRSFGANHFYYFFLGFGGPVVNDEIDTDQIEAEYINQLKFFRDYLQKSPGDAPLKPEPHYPPNYVMRNIIDQISRDFDSIQRAIRQRQSAGKMELLTLELADKWGQTILAEITGEGANKPLKEKATVITYFNSSPRINIIPYANVALIGIPYTTNLADGRRDLLVIPHELGHYVFHFGKIKDNPLKKEIIDKLKKLTLDNDPKNKQKDTILSWTEEIFADIFGTSSNHEIAVVPYALSMIADNLPSHIHVNHGIHPVDAVRIKIYLKTIDKIEKELWSNQTNASLSEVGLLSQQIRAYIDDKKGRILTRGPSHVEATEDFVNNLDKHVEVIFKVISPFIDVQSWETLIFEAIQRGYDQTPTEIQLEKLYERFDARLLEISDNTILSYEIASYADRYEQEKGGITELPVCYDEWKPIFEADGWAIRGPETQPVGGWEGGSFVPNIAIIHP